MSALWVTLEVRNPHVSPHLPVAFGKVCTGFDERGNAGASVFWTGGSPRHGINEARPLLDHVPRDLDYLECLAIIHAAHHGYTVRDGMQTSAD
jgi:hypothetical protein